MFTTEFEHDEILITLLDDNANYEDVSIFLYDDIIYFRQWDEENQNWNFVQMSPEMFNEFMEAMKRPEGAYVTR